MVELQLPSSLRVHYNRDESGFGTTYFYGQLHIEEL